MKILVLKSTMATKPQFKMYLEQDLIDRLHKSADRAGRKSGQAIAEEILTTYLPVWNTVQQSVQQAIIRQAQSEALEFGKTLGELAFDPNDHVKAKSDDKHGYNVGSNPTSDDTNDEEIQNAA